MKKTFTILLIILIVLVICICVFNAQNTTVYDNPEYMSEAALDCIFGWKDTSMFMPLTPFKEETELYNGVRSEISDIMAEIGRSDTFTSKGYIELKKTDSSLYNTIIDTLSENNVTGVKSIRGYTYGFKDGEEITIYVAKIGRKWYTISVEY